MNRLRARLYQEAQAFFGLSRWLRLGMVVFTIAGALDLFYHGVSAYWPGSLDGLLGPDGYYVHLALFFGMTFILIGVMRTRPHPNRATPMVGGDFAQNELNRSSLLR